jgi:Subtilase family
MKAIARDVRTRAKLLTVLIAAFFIAGCGKTDRPVPFEARVDPAVVAAQPALNAAGTPQPVAASRDEKGVQSEFLEGIVLVKPKNPAELKAFVDRYAGTIVGDDAIPQAPRELGFTLSEEQRKPTQFKVRIDPTRANLEALAANAAAAKLTGRLAFSSEPGLRTISALLDARAAGYSVSASYISRGHQGFPVTLFATQERAGVGPPAGFDDPLGLKAYIDYGATGNQSNARLAWQFIAAHGIARRTRVAIIDGGFYLDPAGMPLGTDSDFPASGKPVQYDIDFDDYFADGTNPGPGCGSGNPCFWHGTGSTGSATGVGNNRRGGIGTGWQVADPILLRVNGTKDERNRAIRTAIAWRADVVSMSFGGDCNVSCRIDDRDDNPFDDAVGDGSKVVFIASAGNGRPPDGLPASPSIGFDVGADNFVHPCIEDHVICVGALNGNATTIQSYSNFGGHVLVFAPTNLPMMAYPASQDGAGKALPQSAAFGTPVVPNSFGGTSASAPFVAGVVAMMKALNPDLNHDAVAQILRDTARPGTGLVTRMVDAYAAVRRAAGASPVVRDALENNDLAASPTDLGPTPPYARSNLNIDGRDRDHFKFVSPNGNRMTIGMAYPQSLGATAIDSLESLRDACGVPSLVAGSDQPLAGGGHSLVYRVPGGPLRLGLRATDVNAYNLTIGFASDAYPADDFEGNDSVATAKRLFSRVHAAPGSVTASLTDPRVTIDASLHTDADVDFFIVRGVVATLAEKVLLAAIPTVKVYGNDSQIALEVFRLNADSSQGMRIGSGRSAACGATPLEVTLDENAWFLVKVTGSAGRYTLKNGVRIDPRKIPSLVHTRVDDVIHPGGPVERVLGFPEFLVFVADRAYSALQSARDHVHLQLLDAAGKVVAEGMASGPGERLSLGGTSPGGVYTLAVTPKNIGGDRPLLSLQWEPAKAARTSDNLIVNPGADAAGDGAGALAGWRAVDGFGSVSRLAYSGDGLDFPPRFPGPDQRGEHLFAGVGVGRASAIQQDIVLDPSWRKAISEGRAGARLTAFVGGLSDTLNLARFSVMFFDANQRLVGTLPAPTIGARERDGKTALLPVEGAADVPAGTTVLRVMLTFDASRADRARPALADELRLVLSEFPK